MQSEEQKLAVEIKEKTPIKESAKKPIQSEKGKEIL